jgi:hypothetical protein
VNIKLSKQGDCQIQIENASTPEDVWITLSEGVQEIAGRCNIEELKIALRKICVK